MVNVQKGVLEGTKKLSRCLKGGGTEAPRVRETKERTCPCTFKETFSLTGIDKWSKKMKTRELQGGGTPGQNERKGTFTIRGKKSIAMAEYFERLRATAPGGESTVRG